MSATGTGPDSGQPLAGVTVAVPEARELALFAEMLEARGAATIRVPLVAIRDAPDPAPVDAWIQRLIDGRMDDLVLFTGEGVRRLTARAEATGCRAGFVQALGRVRTVVRGPKPTRALKQLGLTPGLQAAVPTTDGLIDTLRAEALEGRRIGVQLYGAEPNARFTRFLEDEGTTVDTVAPYIYADETDDERVADLIRAMAAGEVDLIAFTAKTQVERLFKVARGLELEKDLTTGLDRVHVAAVGPVVRDTLTAEGVTVHLMPEERWFMKPLVRGIAGLYATGPSGD